MAATTSSENPLDPVLDVLFFAPLGFAIESVNLFPEMAERGRTEINNAKLIGGFAITKVRSTVSGETGNRPNEESGRTAPDGPLTLQKVAADVIGVILPQKTKRKGSSRSSVVGSTATDADRSGAPASVLLMPDAPDGSDSSLLTPDAPVAPDTKATSAAKVAAKKSSKASASTATKKNATKKNATKKKAPKKKAAAQKASAKKKPAAKKAPASNATAPDAGDPVDAGELAIPGYDELSASQVVPMLRSLNKGELRRIQRYESANRGRKTIIGQVAKLLA